MKKESALHWFDMIYLTAIGLTPGGSETVHIYTQYTEYRDGILHNIKKNKHT
jgi:hypothetical protein